jgi:hypothetical protein
LIVHYHSGTAENAGATFTRSSLATQNSREVLAATDFRLRFDYIADLEYTAVFTRMS